MARLHPGDPPVQGAAPAWAGDPVGLWSPESAPTSARPAPPPGSQLRQVRAEYAAMIAAMLGIGIVLAVVALFVHVSDAGAIIATMVGGAVGAGIAAIVGRNAAFTPEARMRHPLAWPDGAVREDVGRTRSRTVGVMVTMTAGFLLLFERLSGNDDSIVFYGGLWLIFGLLCIFKYRKVVRLEQTLGVELYRELSRPPRFRFRPRYYARQP